MHTLEEPAGLRTRVKIVRTRFAEYEQANATVRRNLRLVLWSIAKKYAIAA